MWDATTRPSAAAFFNNGILLATLLFYPRVPRKQNLRQSLHANALGVGAILEKQDQWQKRKTRKKCIIGMATTSHTHTHTSVVIQAYEMSIEKLWVILSLAKFLGSREYGWFIYIFFPWWNVISWATELVLPGSSRRPLGTTSFHRSGGFGPGPSNCHRPHHGGSDRGHAKKGSDKEQW